MDVDVIPEVALRRGPVEAVITASGAAVRDLRVGGRPLLRSFEACARPPGAANIVLAPWPNRVADATFTFRDETYHLAVTEADLGHALHGFTWGRVFDFIGSQTGQGTGQNTRSDAGPSTDSTRLYTVLGPEPGWPWQIALTVHYQLSECGINASMVAENVSDEPAPCALGVHTYLDALGTPLDECVLTHTIMQRQPLDERNIPAGPRQPWPAGPIVMDGAWLDDSGYDPQSRPHIARLTNARGEAVELEASISMPWTQLFTSPQRHLAVEPMTAPPNALATGEGLTVLDPGERMSVSWAVRAILP